MDLVSIIIPVYNTGEPLKACLDSVINQTYSNLEIIVVDDHCIDPLTVEILQDFAQKDPRMKLHICYENHGVSYCRNLGVSLVKGKYFAFLDSDDLLVSNFVELMQHSINENQTDFVVCNKGNFTGANVQEEYNMLFPLAAANVVKTADFVRSKEFMDIPFLVYARLFKTEVFRKKNLLFREEMRYSEDQDWTYRLFCQMDSFSVLAFEGVKHMLRADSLTHSPKESDLLADIASLEYRYEVLKQHDIWPIHKSVFVSHCFNAICHDLEFAASLEVKQKLLAAAEQALNKMGVAFKVHPTWLDKIKAKVGYKLFKLLNKEEQKILYKSIYKYYSAI